MSWLLAVALIGTLADDPAATQPTVILVVGAPGTPEYGADFDRWAGLWAAAASQGSAAVVRIGSDPPGTTTDRDRLQQAIADHASASESPLWIVLIGHGTFDGREAKFNLRGPDITAADVLGWLAAVQRPVVVVNCASASGPWVPTLSGPNRIIAAATRSGDEQNFARFGDFLARSIADPAAADLDKDGQVSLLEALVRAGTDVAEYYRSHSQLATEHALIDDNGDRQGTPAEWFRGTRVVTTAKSGAEPDGLRSHQVHLVPNDREQRLTPDQRHRRDELERSIEALRKQKATLADDAYYTQLEPILLELARLYGP
jgi:hypothetical protein